VHSHCATHCQNCHPPAVAETMNIPHASTHFLHLLFRKIIHCKPTPPNNVRPCLWRSCPMFQTFKNHQLSYSLEGVFLKGLITPMSTG
jgi:hypothetical protein